MQIKIKKVNQSESHAHFFKGKGLKVEPTCVEIFIKDIQSFSLIKDPLSPEESSTVTTMVINNKTDFESLSSAILERFVSHLKEHYPNLERIVGYEEKDLDNLIKLNKVNEELLPLQEKHTLIPQLIKRINTNKLIIIENKIQALEQLNLFLQDTTEEQLGLFAAKISQLDERQHNVSDLIKAIGLFVVGSVIGLFFCSIASKSNDGQSSAAGFGFIFGVSSILGAIGGACDFGSLYLNNGEEDRHYPDKDKIVEIGSICSKMR